MLIPNYRSAVRHLALGCFMLLVTPLVGAQQAQDSGGPEGDESRSAFSVDLDKHLVGDQVHYRVTVKADEQAVDGSHTHVVAHIENSLGYSSVQALERQGQQRWQLNFSPQRRARYRIDLEASGRRLEGDRLRESLSTQYFEFPEPGDPFVMPEDREIAAINAELEAMKKGTAGELRDSPFSPSDSSSPGVEGSDQSRRFNFEGNLVLYIAVILANIIVMALLGFGFWVIKNNADIEDRRAKYQKDTEKSEEEESSVQPSMQNLTSSSASAQPEPSKTPESDEPEAKMSMDGGSNMSDEPEDAPRMQPMGGVGEISSPDDKND